MPYLSLAPYILKRPWLTKMVMPIANWYCQAAGWRQMGLRADDLISEENEHVLTALSRLSAKESYDRIYRIRRATQLSLQQKILPKNEWTRAEEDVPYLTPILKQVYAEIAEKDRMDTMTVSKDH